MSGRGTLVAMAFEIPPAPLRPRTRRSAIAVAASGIALIAFALVTSAVAPSDRHSASPAALARASGGPAPTTIYGFVRVPPRALPAPAMVACHGLHPAACARVIRAAVDILPPDAPTIASVGAWSSILCSDDFDCPPQRMTGYQPLGSSIISFGPGQPQAWINVVERASPVRRSAASAPLVAWIIRWQS
jgi:hypothetical protein